MKVCFVVGTLGRGGAEKQLAYMLRALVRTGNVPRVLCLTKGESYEAEIGKLGVEIEWVGEAENRLVRLLKIINNLRKTPADIIQSSHFYTNIYAGAAGRILKIPSIGAVRSDLIYEIKSHNFFGRWQISLPHLLITNSGLAQQRLLARGVLPQKIEFVRNVVEVGESKAENDDRRHTLKILFVGRLDRNKNPQQFVRLASILSERFPDRRLQFQIAGDGGLRNEIENLARELKLLPGKLKILGECREMDEIYRQADILISTSESEGTPNVILEAMAHGLPVAATKVGGTTEILTERSGFLITPGDENGLVSAAAELVSDENLRRRLGSEGRKYVLQNHSLDYLQKHLAEIYGRLVRKFNQPANQFSKANFL